MKGKILHFSIPLCPFFILVVTSFVFLCKLGLGPSFIAIIIIANCLVPYLPLKTISSRFIGSSKKLKENWRTLDYISFMRGAIQIKFMNIIIKD